MSLSRIFSVVVVSVVLLAVAVPAAQARTLDTSSRVLRPVDGSWLAASMSWLSHFLGVEMPVPSAIVKVDTTTQPPSLTTGGRVPMTGACIDPLGSTRCNL
jgi:hypothetical protein